MIEQRAAYTRASAASIVFSMTFGVVYSICFYFNWAPFAYFPQVNEVHFSTQMDANGPPILWYGWLLTAALASAAVAAIVPRGVVARIWQGWAWLVPAAVVVAILIYEKRWFL
jgi:hypothetical protein